MLILRRKKGTNTNLYYRDEKGQLRKITLTLLSCSNSEIRLGIDANEEVQIFREEIDKTDQTKVVY